MKVLVFVLGTLLAVQAHSENYEHIRPQPRDISDEAKKALQKLLDGLDKAITTASEQVNNAFNFLKEQAEQLKASAKAELQGALEKLQGELDEINKKAAEKGVDLAPCVHFEQEFKNIPNVLLDNVVACVTNKINEAQAIVNDALTRVQQIEQEAKNYEQEIKDCGHGFHAIKCLSKLVVKIVKQVDELPVKVAEDVAKATVLIQTLVPSLETCAAGKAQDVAVQGAETLAEFALCAGVNI